MGYRFLETDAHVTRDGVVVAFHDPRLDGLTDRTGAIASLPIAEVEAADAGFAFSPDGGRSFPFRGRGVRVPRLETLLLRWPDARVNIDPKDDACRRAARRAARPSRCLGSRQRGVVLGSAPAPDPGAQPRSGVHVDGAACRGRGARRSVGRPDAPPGRRLRPGADPGRPDPDRHGRLRPGGSSRRSAGACLDRQRSRGDARAARARGRWRHDRPPARGRVRIVTPGFVRAAHRAGLPVHVWTVNDPAAMRELLELGVDGVMTDRPRVLREVLAERGVSLPARSDTGTRRR